MKITHFIDDLLGSKSKIRILRIIFKYPNREFTEREIAKTINMSPNTVNLALAELRRTNIFYYKRIGKTHSYRCNPESILFIIIKDLFEKEHAVKESLFELLKKKLDFIKSCIIFGSYAIGQEEFDSDLDLLIISEDKLKVESVLEEVSEEILRRFSIVISPVILTPKELKARIKKPFIKEALEFGKVILGKEFIIDIK